MDLTQTNPLEPSGETNEPAQKKARLDDSSNGEQRSVQTNYPPLSSIDTTNHITVLDAFEKYKIHAKNSDVGYFDLPLGFREDFISLEKLVQKGRESINAHAKDLVALGLDPGDMSRFLVENPKIAYNFVAASRTCAENNAFQWKKRAEEAEKQTLGGRDIFTQKSTSRVANQNKEDTFSILDPVKTLGTPLPRNQHDANFVSRVDRGAPKHNPQMLSKEYKPLYDAFMQATPHYGLEESQ